MERNIASSISSTFEPGIVVGDSLILLRPRPAYCMAVGILPQRGRAVRDADATLAAKGLVRKSSDIWAFVANITDASTARQASPTEPKESWISLVHFARVLRPRVGGKALSMSQVKARLPRQVFFGAKLPLSSFLSLAPRAEQALWPLPHRRRCHSWLDLPWATCPFG
jgi:hypothetical protein